MKFSKGDKVAAVCVKSIVGVDFICYTGTLVKVKSLQGVPAFVLEARKCTLIDGSATDMKKTQVELSSCVWKLHRLNDKTRSHLEETRMAAAQVLKLLRRKV